MIYETDATAPSSPLVWNSKLIHKALEWARGVTSETEPGNYEIQGEDLFAMYQIRSGLPREERLEVETHRNYADMQYCLEGGEIIDWYPSESLTPNAEYDPVRDIQFYDRPEQEPIPLPMHAGCFTLLFPGDGHVPQVADNINSSCRMIVFKLRISAL